MNQKGFANLIVIGIVLVVVFGVGGYFVLVRKPATPSETLGTRLWCVERGVITSSIKVQNKKGIQPH